MSTRSETKDGVKREKLTPLTRASSSIIGMRYRCHQHYSQSGLTPSSLFGQKIPPKREGKTLGRDSPNERTVMNIYLIGRTRVEFRGCEQKTPPEVYHPRRLPSGVVSLSPPAIHWVYMGIGDAGTATQR